MVYDKEYHAKYYRQNKNKIIERKRLYHQNNKDKLNKKRRDYYKEHKDKFNTKQRIYINNNIQHIRKVKRRYQRNRRKIDIEYNILCRLRTLLYNALKKYSTTGKIQSSSKYGIDYFSIIEKLKPFPENLSYYDIDHITPVCMFNLCNSDGTPNLEQIRNAFSSSNLRWLESSENRSRGAKLKLFFK